MSRFDTLVDRSRMSTVKQAYTPVEISRSGNLSLWGAEFEFPTAEFVVDAVVEWAKTGLYAYTVENQEFRDLVCAWMINHRRWTISPEWIVPVYGITASLATAMRAFTEKGDGIIGMTPGYHMYWNAVELSERKKVLSRLLYNGKTYSIDWADIEEKLADDSNKILVVCNPHNPIGKVFSCEDIQRLGELAIKYDKIIFNDEIFAECLYDKIDMVTFNQVVGNDVKVISASSLGKWLSFTGTNQANLIIPNVHLREAFITQRDREFYGSMNPMMLPAYKAAYSKQGERWLFEMMKYIQQNFELVDSFFGTRIPGFKAIKPEGTFVLWADARDFMNDERQLADFLVNEAHFHVDMGSQYNGDDGFFRMTLSVPRTELEKNLLSLEAAVRRLSQSEVTKKR